MSTSSKQRAAVDGIPVQMVPTTAREHITGFAALNIPHGGRPGGDWHEAWFDVKPAQVSPYHLTNEARFGRLLDRLGQGGLRDARPGLRLLEHPAGDWPEKIWGSNARARCNRDGLGAAPTDGGQRHASRATAGGPLRLLPNLAAPRPVGTGPLVGMAPAEGTDARGIGSMERMAEGMVAMKCPEIPFTKAEEHREAYLGRLAAAFQTLMDQAHNPCALKGGTALRFRTG